MLSCDEPVALSSLLSLGETGTVFQHTTRYAWEEFLSVLKDTALAVGSMSKQAADGKNCQPVKANPEGVKSNEM